MIIVNEAHLADICVSATKAGFWVRGEFKGYMVDMHFSQILSVKYYLRNLEAYFKQGCPNSSIAVFDMTERVFK